MAAARDLIASARRPLALVSSWGSNEEFAAFAAAFGSRVRAFVKPDRAPKPGEVVEDALLIRADKNPNTTGALALFPVWDGEFHDEVGASVSADGKPYHPYSVFTSRQSGKAGLVICNYDEKQAVTVQASLDSGASLQRWRLVDGSDWEPIGAGIVIPACSAVVVL